MEQLLIDSFLPNHIINNIKELDAFLELVNNDNQFILLIYEQCLYFGYFETIKYLDKKFGYSKNNFNRRRHKNKTHNKWNST